MKKKKVILSSGATPEFQKQRAVHFLAPEMDLVYCDIAKLLLKSKLISETGHKWKRVWFNTILEG